MAVRRHIGSHVARYFSVLAPASWTKSGTTRVTVRTGGSYEVYLCVGNDRVPLTCEQAWALYAALGQALTETSGTAPQWLTDQCPRLVPGAVGSADQPGVVAGGRSTDDAGRISDVNLARTFAVYEDEGRNIQARRGDTDDL